MLNQCAALTCSNSKNNHVDDNNNNEKSLARENICLIKVIMVSYIIRAAMRPQSLDQVHS